MARRKSYQRGNVQKHNGQWTLRYREWNYDTRKWEQKRIILEGNYKNEKAARHAADPIMACINEHNNAGKAPVKQFDSRITFQQFVETRWRAYARAAKMQPTTTDLYNSLLKNHLFPAFGSKHLTDITPGQVADFQAGLSKLSASTHASMYNLLKVIFDLAVQYDVIPESPIRPKIHRPALDKREKPTLTPEQIRKVIAEMPEDYRLLTSFVAGTGKRIGEILALRWCDFKPATSELEIKHTIYKGKPKQLKTKASRATLRLKPIAAELLCAHKDQSEFQAATDFIFCRPDGVAHSPHALRHHLKRAMKRAGIETEPGMYGFHIFRHSAGSLVYEKTRDLKLVQETLGHATVRTTSDIYVHLQGTAKEEGAAILMDEIFPSCDLTVTSESEKVS